MNNLPFYKVICLLLFLLITTSSYSQIEATFNFAAEGQRVCLVDATVTKVPPTVTLHFKDASLNTNQSTSVYRRPLYGTGADWILKASSIPAGTSSWTDTDVNQGEVWEYQVKRTNSTGNAFGYVAASVYHDQSDYKGRMILLIADDLALPLTNEFVRLKKDLTGDGWHVTELLVPKGNSNFNDGNAVVSVKSQIDAIYQGAPPNDKPKVLFIVGQVPLPRLGQGLQAPDGHIEATGARGSDSYYADLNGIFTDTATYDIPQQNNALLKNLPGDFKWDQDKIPSSLEMAYGRVSFHRIDGGQQAEEIADTKQYLDRLHAFRYVSNGTKLGSATAFNELGFSNSTDASYRSLPALSGGDFVTHSSVATSDGHNSWVKNNGPFMWYMSNRHVPFFSEWTLNGMDALVYSSDQSNYGYGDLPHNQNDNNGWQGSAIRKTLQYDSKCLISLWTTSAINVFHAAGVGEPLGVVCKHIMEHDVSNQHYEKNPAPWDTPDWWNRTHFNFFGDPSLRLYQTFPPSNLQAGANTNGFKLEWDPSPDQNLIGYHVYKSDDEFGVYQRITNNMSIDTTFFEDPNYQIGDWYMVRAIAEQLSGSGVFIHPSQGIFIEGQIMVANESVPTENHFFLYPNPAMDLLSISSDLPIEKLEIWSVDGRLLESKTINNHSSIELDISHLISGSYLIRLSNDKQMTEKRFVKL